MPDRGEKKKGTLRPDFKRRIKPDFQDASLSKDGVFPLRRKIDKRFEFIEEIAADLLDARLSVHTRAFHYPDDSSTVLTDGCWLLKLP